MERLGFILPESVLDEVVPDNFIEPQGTFKDYLREFYVKDGKVIFDCNRKSDTGMKYQPSEVEMNLWREYFGSENEVNFDEQIGNFNNNENETTDII